MDENKNIISIQEARKLLGKSAKAFSDNQIRILIKELQNFALILIGNLRNPDSNAK